MQKKVSIIIPYYNGSAYIKETISSCYKQIYENLEIIVIDDCSNQKESIYLDSIAVEFEGIRVLRNDINRGTIYTCNRGSKECTGEYLLFLGQDDVLQYTHVSNIMKIFDEGVTFVYSIPFLIDEKGNKITEDLEISEHKHKHENIYFFMGKENIIPSTGLIIDRRYFEKAGRFNEEYKNYGEWHLWIRLLREGKCRFCTSEHALYRRHSSNMTNAFVGRENIDKQIILHKYWNECRELAARSFEYDLKKKFYLFIYRKKVWFRTWIADRWALICIKRAKEL